MTSPVAGLLASNRAPDSDSAQAPPITEYVRCAAAHYPALAAVAAGAVSLLLGNWLWYPTR